MLPCAEFLFCVGKGVGINKHYGRSFVRLLVAPLVWFLRGHAQGQNKNGLSLAFKYFCSPPPPAPPWFLDSFQPDGRSLVLRHPRKGEKDAIRRRKFLAAGYKPKERIVCSPGLDVMMGSSMTGGGQWGLLEATVSDSQAAFFFGVSTRFGIPSVLHVAKSFFLFFDSDSVCHQFE